MNHTTALQFFASNGNSRSQEKYAEYHFLKDLILEAATQNKNIAVSRSDFDAFGFDVMLGLDNDFILVQMKAYSGKAAVWDVHKSLIQSSNGRVILVQLSLTGSTERPILIPRYFQFNRINSAKALQRPAKVKNEKKCRTNFGDYVEITDKLLSIFQ